MKKSIKKIMSMFLALTMCLSLGVVAFAAEPTNTSSDKGTITIRGLEDGVTVTAYQITTAMYDESTGYFTGYKMVDAVLSATFQIGSDGSYEEDNLTEANLAELFNLVNGSTYKSVTSSGDTATFEEMEVGSYLFVVTGSESTVYGMVIASVSYDTDDSGDLTLDEGTVSVEDGSAWAKSTTPTLTKTETGGSLDDQEHGGSADAGDTLTYTITISSIPTYEGSNPEFKVNDIISNNLTTDTDSIVVKIGENTLTSGTDYTVDTIDGGFCIDFVVSGSYTLNAYAGMTMTITYDATVTGTGDGSADDVDHTNDATLIFSTTSYVDGQDGSSKDGDHDYTFNAKIKKVDQDNQALGGATFTLYTDEGCTTEYTQNGVAVTATSASADGYFEFTGLEEGTYYMKETTAPNGYALNTNIYKIEITPLYDGTEEDHTTLQSVTIAVTDVTNNREVGSALVSAIDDNRATIENVKTGTLPSMGAQGITMLIIAGCAVLVVAFGGAIIYRRRNTVA